MKLSLRRLAAALVTSAALGVLTLGAAQAQSKIDEAKIQAYVTASIAIDSVVTQWGPKIEGAKSEQEAQSLKERANTELSKAIETTEGISIDEYMQISDATQSDTTLQRRLKQAFEKRMGGK